MGRSGDVKRNNLLGWPKIFLKGFATFVISKDVAIVRGLVASTSFATVMNTCSALEADFRR